MRYRDVIEQYCEANPGCVRVRFDPGQVTGYLSQLFTDSPRGKYRYAADGSTFAFRDAGAARWVLGRLREARDWPWQDAESRSLLDGQIAKIAGALG